LEKYRIPEENMTNITDNSQFILRRDFREDIVNEAYMTFLRDKQIPFTAIREDLLNTFEENVRNGNITNAELSFFLDRETRYGHNRTLFIRDIDKHSLRILKSLSENDLKSLISSKGINIPEINNILNVYLPETLTIGEFYLEENQKITITFIETIHTTRTNTVARENNYYFVEIDFINEMLLFRMRPRANQIGTENIKVPYYNHFYRILQIVERTFNISTIGSTHYKNTLYDITKELTIRAEEPWRLEVEKHEEVIKQFAQEMEAKLDGLDTSKFDLKFRLQRLMERSLIQSNFKLIKQNEPGKKGYIHMFHFSDKSGGKIKASSKERERAIELSEIYYDTRDTIDKEKAFDIIWVYWFLNNNNNKTVSTKLEANEQFFQVHFFKYLLKDDMNHVLSQIRTFI
jgi:hypothetical protein